MLINKPNVLRDTLYNCDTDCTLSAERASLKNKTKEQVYAQGVLLGVVGALMSHTNWTLEQTAKNLKDYLPSDLDPTIIPEVWRDLTWEGRNKTYSLGRE